MITRQRHDKIVASVKREAQEKGWLSPPPGSITGLYVILTFCFPFVWFIWIDWFHYCSEGRQKRVALLLLFSTRSKGKEVRRHLFLNRIGTAFLPSPVFSTSSITATASYLGDRIPRLSYLNESPYLVAVDFCFDFHSLSYWLCSDCWSRNYKKMPGPGKADSRLAAFFSTGVVDQLINSFGNWPLQEDSPQNLHMH